MKKLILWALLCIPIAAGAQSIDSKIESMGRMDHLQVAGLKSAVRDGLLKLQIEVVNDWHNQQVLHWRVRWLDEDGFQVGGDEPWKQELLHGKQRKVLQIAAPTRRAADFKIELQSPENSAYGASTSNDDQN
jgi:hypothetical protein